MRDCNEPSALEVWPFCSSHWYEWRNGVTPEETQAFADRATPARADPHWPRRAACRGRTELMFPSKIAPDGWPIADETPSKVALAKDVCAGCTVKAECLDAALEADEVGIWGGMSTAERKRLRKARRWGSCVTPVDLDLSGRAPPVPLPLPIRRSGAHGRSGPPSRSRWSSF